MKTRYTVKPTRELEDTPRRFFWSLSPALRWARSLLTDPQQTGEVMIECNDPREPYRYVWRDQAGDSVLEEEVHA